MSRVEYEIALQAFTWGVIWLLLFAAVWLYLW